MPRTRRALLEQLSLHLLGELMLPAAVQLQHSCLLQAPFEGAHSGLLAAPLPWLPSLGGGHALPQQAAAAAGCWAAVLPVLLLALHALHLLLASWVQMC